MRAGKKFIFNTLIYNSPLMLMVLNVLGYKIFVLKLRLLLFLDELYLGYNAQNYLGAFVLFLIFNHFCLLMIITKSVYLMKK